MAFMIDGFGTKIVKASAPIKANGNDQYEALVAFVVLYIIPILPIKCVYVLSLSHGQISENYQTVPLRMSWRIAFKAMFNAWGNFLLMLGAAGLVTAIIVLWPLPRNIEQYKGLTAWLIFLPVAMLIVGLVCKVCWLALNKIDERIKAVIGHHELGSSDPYTWTEEVAHEVAVRLLEEKNADCLVQLARQFADQRQSGRAMLCIRLAMRERVDEEAQSLFRKLLQAHPA